VLKDAYMVLALTEWYRTFFWDWTDILPTAPNASDTSSFRNMSPLGIYGAKSTAPGQLLEKWRVTRVSRNPLYTRSTGSRVSWKSFKIEPRRINDSM
jgi:hypothetical protein